MVTRLEYTLDCLNNIRNNTANFEDVRKCGDKWLCMVDNLTLGLYDKQIEAAIVHDIAVTFLDDNDSRKKLNLAYDIESDKIPNVYREFLFMYKDQLLDKKKDEIKRKK